MYAQHWHSASVCVFNLCQQSSMQDDRTAPAPPPMHFEDFCVNRYKQMLVRYSELVYHSRELYYKPQSIMPCGACESCGGRCTHTQRECVVCLQPAEQWVMMRPCGHVCACSACARALDSCPVCRCAIDERLVAFV